MNLIEFVAWSALSFCVLVNIFIGSTTAKKLLHSKYGLIFCSIAILYSPIQEESFIRLFLPQLVHFLGFQKPLWPSFYAFVFSLLHSSNLIILKNYRYLAWQMFATFVLGYCCSLLPNIFAQIGLHMAYNAIVPLCGIYLYFCKKSESSETDPATKVPYLKGRNVTSVRIDTLKRSKSCSELFPKKPKQQMACLAKITDYDLYEKSKKLEKYVAGKRSVFAKLENLRPNGVKIKNE